MQSLFSGRQKELSSEGARLMGSDIGVGVGVVLAMGWKQKQKGQIYTRIAEDRPTSRLVMLWFRPSPCHGIPDRYRPFIARGWSHHDQ